MCRLLIFGGTTEGRELSQFCADRGILALVSVASEYGKTLVPQSENLKVLVNRLTEKEMSELIARERVCLVVDATHPYAAEATENIKSACRAAGVEYIRCLRDTGSSLGAEAFCTAEELWAGKGLRSVKELQPAKEKGDLPQTVSGTVFYVQDAGEAVRFLEQTEGAIFVTTGSKELSAFAELSDYKSRVFARVLPSAEPIRLCERLGISGKHLIGMQGPFSRELNAAMMRQAGAKWMVTKETGKNGGFEEKMRAAADCGVRTVVIGKPRQEEGEDLEKVKSRILSFWEKTEGIQEGNFQKKTKGRQEGKLQGKNGGKPERKLQEKAEGKTEGKFREKTEGRPEGNFQEKTGGKPEGKSQEKTDEKQEEKKAGAGDGPGRTGGPSVILAGIGPGSPEQMTLAAAEAILKSSVLLGAPRMLEAAGRLWDWLEGKGRWAKNGGSLFYRGQEPVFTDGFPAGSASEGAFRRPSMEPVYRPEDVIRFIRQYREGGEACGIVTLLFSGDTGFYSGTKGMEKALREQGLAFETLPGISSVSYLASRLGVPWENAGFLTAHGRELDLAGEVRKAQTALKKGQPGQEEKWLFTLLAGTSAAGKLCRELLEQGFGELEAAVGERLSYPDERIRRGAAGELSGIETAPLSLLAVKVSEGRREENR